MNIFNVPQGFWEEHTFLYVTIVVSLAFNIVLLGLLFVRGAADRLERKAKERMEMIEQIVKRVKREMKQEEREKK